MPPWQIRALRVQSIRHGIQRRHFSPSVETVDLAFDLYKPEKQNGSLNNPIVFIHGFFGSKKNNRTMSKVLARDLNRPVYAVDLRNHGDSPHHKSHTYPLLASDISAFLQKHDIRKPTLIGHSMGAKAAMVVALSQPQTVQNLIPVDNAPVDANFKSDFGSFITGMREVAKAKPKKQSEADEILKPFAKELAVRQFLMTNLVRHPESKDILSWRVPVETLANSLDAMMDFPYTNPDELRYQGKTLFVRGTKSHYVPDETLPIIGRFFPRFELEDIEAGHWVISEAPEKFRQAVVEWLQDKE